MHFKLTYKTLDSFFLCVFVEYTRQEEIMFIPLLLFFILLFSHYRVPVTISSCRSLDKLWNWQWRHENKKLKLKNLPFKELFRRTKASLAIFRSGRRENGTNQAIKIQSWPNFCDYIIASRLPTAICCWFGFNLTLWCAWMEIRIILILKFPGENCFQPPRRACDRESRVKMKNRKSFLAKIKKKNYGEFKAPHL